MLNLINLVQPLYHQRIGRIFLEIFQWLKQLRLGHLIAIFYSEQIVSMQLVIHIEE